MAAKRQSTTEPLPHGATTNTTVPPHLMEEIEEGRCVAFVGAGFSAAARLPTWTSLLTDLAKHEAVPPDVRDRVREVVDGPPPSAHQLDQAAQLLEDSMGRALFVSRLAVLLRGDPSSDQMQQRLRWLRGIPFRAIVTTNFDPVLEGALPGPRVYRSLLRPDRYRWWEEAFWGDERGAPVVKLHGDLSHPDAANNVVLTRRDYRRRLYGDPAYTTFLRGLLSTNTILFMGFSFEDAYLNELRSQVLALFDQASTPDDPPLAYAILHDVPNLVRLHFSRHEGIEVLPFNSTEPDNFGGFDQWLEAIWSATAILPRFGRLLSGRRIIWLDPYPDETHAGRRFLERAAATASGDGVGIHSVATVDEALGHLRADRHSTPVDLVITHWGYAGAPEVGAPPFSTAETLLHSMRKDDIRCPVVIFSTPNDATPRRAATLALGAHAYCWTWDGLLQAIDRVLRRLVPQA